jgi:hypothetical protein
VDALAISIIATPLCITTGLLQYAISIDSTIKILFAFLWSECHIISEFLNTLRCRACHTSDLDFLEVTKYLSA